MEEKKDEQELEQERKNEETKRQVLGTDIPIAAMRFDLKNVKLKIPKVPHTIFGRLMAKDDYFPTAIATFEFDFKRSYLQDRRKVEEQEHVHKSEKAKLDDGSRKEPETLQLPIISSFKMQTADSKEEKFVKIGLLTVRVIGYVTSKAPDNQGKDGGDDRKGKADDGEDEEGDDDQEEEDEDADEDEEAEDEE